MLCTRTQTHLTYTDTFRAHRLSCVLLVLVWLDGFGSYIRCALLYLWMANDIGGGKAVSGGSSALSIFHRPFLVLNGNGRGFGGMVCFCLSGYGRL